MNSLRTSGPRARRRATISLFIASVLLSLVLPPGLVQAAGPQPTTPPPAAGTPPAGPGEPGSDGRAVERPAINLGIAGTAGPAGQAGHSTLDPSVGLRPSFPKTVPPKKTADLKALWTGRSRTVANPDGTYSMQVSPGRLNYQDATGDWQPIDLSLVGEAHGKYGLKVKANDKAVRFAQGDAEAALAELSTDGATISLRALDFPSRLVGGPASAPAGPGATPSPTPTAAAASAPTDPTSPAAPSAAPAASAQPSSSAPPASSASPDATPTAAPSAAPNGSPGNAGKEDKRLAFAKDASSGEITVEPTDEGFEFGVVLKSAKQADTYSFALDTGGLEASVGPDGQTVVLTRLDPERSLEPITAGVISAPIVRDANDIPAPAATVSVGLYVPGSGAATPKGLSAKALAGLASGEVVLTYTLDPAYLAAPDRVYPVTLDPDACLGEGASGCFINGTGVNLDHFVGSGIAALYPVGWTTMRVGYDSRSDDGDTYGTMRGLVYFQDVALPDGAVVYDTDLQLHISSEYGGPSGEAINIYRITDGWSQTTTWNQWTSGAGYTTTGGVATTAPTSGYMHFDTDAIVQSWYTRRGADWKGDLGFAVKMGADSSGHGEVEYDRYNDATAAYRPLLTIHFEVPKVAIDFDPALGANYAPSTMIAGQQTTLPIKVSNNGSGFDFVTANWLAGYRWFDAKGKQLSAVQQALPSCVGTGSGCVNPSATFGLNVTPPTTAGHYTLRLDLVRNGTIDTWASDWAKPSLFLSRNKKSLSGDSTRWTGSSVVERDEYSIGVVLGGGDSGTAKSVETGDGGSLALDLWTRNLSYTGDGGIGFADLSPMDLDYGYDSRNVTDCVGILDACGWSTTWDERFIPGTVGAYTYVGPSGNRYLVDSDPDQQLASGAPVLLQRPRTTLFDENVPANSPTAALVTPSFGAFSGQYAVKVAANTLPGVGVSGAGTTELNTYRNVRFAVRTDSAASAGIDFKIHNVDKNTDRWFIYTVGPDWATGFDQVALGGTINGSSWAYFSRDLYQDIRNDGDFGGTYDDFQVTAVQIQNKSAAATGSIYLDGLRLEAAQSTIIDETNPAWTSGTPLTSVATGDTASGSNAIKVNVAPIATSPDCNTTGAACWGTSAGGLWSYAFAHWQWKKVGGRSAAIVFHFKDKRTGAPCSTTACDLTYYAGPTVPVGAVNPIQVSDATPVGWALVTRNILEDARQVLNLYNDNAGGSSPSAPPSQGPTPDDVQLVGYKVSAVDGNFVLIDDFDYGSLPDVGADEANHPGSTGDVTFTYDFTATYRDGSIHYFNNLGLLERIADRDKHQVELDWSIPNLGVGGAAGYQLDRIRAATDGTTSGSWTYDRQVDVTYATGTSRTVTFAERLGTTANPITGRSTVFTVATAAGTNAGIGDVSAIKPARAPSCAPSGSPSGCNQLSYTDGTNHLLQFVGDPRWNQTSTSGANDQRFEITWGGTAPNQYPTGVVDRSQGTSGTPLLRVMSYSVGGGLPAATRVAWQDAAALRANAATYADITSDGKTIVDYIPLTCGGSDCSTLPLVSNLANQRASENQFDGLARENTSISYRCPGVAVSGCPGTTAQKVVSRQGTKAGAKVDNFNDPLTAGQTGWTQTADQYVASLRDSGGVDPDLYRTFYAYDENGQQVGASRPAYSARVDYPATMKSTPQSASALKGYWRLGETSGAAIDAAPTPHNGTYTGGVTLNAAPALVNDADRSATFNGSTGFVSIPGTLGTVSGSFSVSAWVKPTSATTTMAFIGSRKSNTATTDYTFDTKLYYDPTGHRNVRVDVGNGTGWMLSGNVPYDYAANRWYQIVVVVDDPTDRASVYVNGNLAGTLGFLTTPTGTPILADATRILKIGNNGRDSITPEWFSGGIDDVAIYSQALTAPQVQSQYLAGHGVALDTQSTLRDRQWRPIQVDDQFLSSPGFESGLVDWDFGQGNGGSVYTATNPATDPNVHQPSDPTLPASWASFKTGLSGNAQQDVQLVPGQTFRFQVWDKRVGTTGQANISVYYWKRSAATWASLVSSAKIDSAWASHAWDVTLPLDTDGRVRVALWTSGLTGTDTIYFDDVALLTTYGRTNYTAFSVGDPFDGLVKDTITFSPVSNGPIGEFIGRNGYAASATTPPIFSTTTTSNYVDGVFTSATPDMDVTTTSTYDAWGHVLTATDQDGVKTTTDYIASSSANGFATDVADTRNGLDETTAYVYDLVGNKTQVTTPKNETTTTTYDLRNHVLTTTDPAPIGTVARNVYDAYGFMTSSIANRIDDTPSGPAGLDDVTTTYTYDEFGEQTSTTENAGVSGTTQTRTSTLHDLVGNDVSTTQYASFDGTTFGAPRTTTKYAEVASGAWRPKPSGTRGPGSLVPSGAPAPVCPDGSGTFCNSVATLDQDGAAVSTKDAYGVVSRSFFDIGGKTVFSVINYVDGVYDPAAPATDLVTTTQNDLFGRPAVVTDPLSRKTVATFDALGRTIKSTVYDWDGTASHAISDTKTVFTGAGRVDRTTLPGTAGAADSSFTWTKSGYDGAGRQTATLANFDISGAAQLQLSAFEGGLEGWTGGTSGWFTASAATVAIDSSAAKSGRQRLAVTTSAAGSFDGAWTALPGTFKQGHVYRLTASAWVPSGTTIESFFGADASGASYATMPGAQGAGTGAWAQVDYTWTPAADVVGARVAFRKPTAGAITFYLDNVTVWDTASPDRNIPTTTAYDADGHIGASVVAPGVLGGTEQPMVTGTTYDALGRVTAITVDVIAGAGTSAPDVNLATTTTFDALGRESTKTDPTGTVTKFGYDRLDRVLSTTLNYQDGLAGGATTDDDVMSRFAYDAVGELTGYCSAGQVYLGGCDETSPSNAQAWHYGYDDAGHVATQTPPVNTTAAALATTNWVYDAGGRLAKTCDAPAGTTNCTAAGVLRTTVPTYDAAGRATRSDTFSGPGTTLALRTDTTFLGDGQPAQTKYYEGATPTLVDTIDYAYDTSGRQIKQLRGATVLSERSYNPDGTVAWRKDGDNNAIGQSNFTYDWAKRLISVDLPDAFSTALPTFGWRLDGLIGSRTWSGGSATFGYDAAKRVTQIAKGSLTQTQTYDRDGNVASEARAFTGIGGDAGTGTQSFTYDGLSRVTGSSGLASGTRSYSYDRDSNRTSKTEAGVTFSYVFDRTDELVSVLKSGGTTQSFGYDAYGNLTSNAETGVSVTASTYDLGDKLTKIDATGTADDASFTFDALGRFATRALGGGTSTDTYSYLDTSETVARIANSASGTTDSVVDTAGDRLGVKVGTTLNWFLPDPHGDIAGSLDATEATVVNAIRYDAYGQTITTGTAGGTRVGDTSWKYQGRLDISPTGLGTPLYDMSARFYDPGIGAFTQFDSVMGSAQNPISMNRFLYAAANPETLTDPTGHCWGICIDNFDPLGFAGKVVENAGNFGAGFVEGAVGSIVDAGAAIVTTTVSAGGCALSSSCRDSAVASIGRGVQAFVRDPGRAVGSAAGAVVEGVKGAVGSAVNRIGTAWSTGNFRELGKVSGEVAATFIPVGGILAKGGMVLRGLGDVAGASRFLRGASELAEASRVGRAVEGVGARLEGAASRYGRPDGMFRPGPYAGRSIAADGASRSFPKALRADIDDIMHDTGCHACGSKVAGTRSGHAIPDHMPPIKANPLNLPMRLYPHCLACSRRQGGLLSWFSNYVAPRIMPQRFRDWRNL